MTEQVKPLISLQLASKRPHLFAEFVKNCEQTCSDPSNIEVLVGIDLGDKETLKEVEKLSRTSKLSIRYIQKENPEGYFGLYNYYNELFSISAPSAYFHSIVTDELRFKTKHWDKELLKLKGFFSDDIFRVRCSKYKFRSYSDFWECGYAPDSYAFHTRKWLEEGFGKWCPNGTPDSFQQSVAFYLQEILGYSKDQLYRDIILYDFEFEGETPYMNISEKERTDRIIHAQEEWYQFVSTSVQKKAFSAALNLAVYIIDTDLKNSRSGVVKRIGDKIYLHKHNCIERLYYQKPSFLWQKLINRWRKQEHGYYCGGGSDHINLINPVREETIS